MALVSKEVRRCSPNPCPHPRKQEALDWNRLAVHHLFHIVPKHAAATLGATKRFNCKSLLWIRPATRPCSMLKPPYRSSFHLAILCLILPSALPASSPTRSALTLRCSCLFTLSRTLSSHGLLHPAMPSSTALMVLNSASNLSAAMHINVACEPSYHCRHPTAL